MFPSLKQLFSKSFFSSSSKTSFNKNYSTESKRPRCFFDVDLDGKSKGRIVFEVHIFLIIFI